MLHDVFLDFLNRDSREIYGIYGLAPASHLVFLTDALTVAVFLCADHCILPPGFLAESGYCREALMRRRPEYFDERLVRLSMKEYSLDEFWDKKEQQYKPFREKYKGLYDPRNHRLLRGVSNAIIPRKSSIADSILTGWERAPDANPIWRGSIHGLSPGTVERIRRIPSDILNEGVAITWPAILGRITDAVDRSKFRPVLQNVYFTAYLREYNLKVITSLPYTSHPFVVTGKGLAYDYEGLKAALGAAGIWEMVRALSAPSMIYLRGRGGYFRFRGAFDRIASGTDNVSKIREIFTLAAEVRKPNRTFQSVAKRNSPLVLPVGGVVVPRSEMDEITERLTSLAEAALEVAEDLKADEPRIEFGRKRRIVSSSIHPRISKGTCVAYWFQGAYAATLVAVTSRHLSAAEPLKQGGGKGWRLPRSEAAARGSAEL